MAEIDTSIYRTAPAKSPMDQINEIQDFQQKKLNMAVGQQKYISNVLGSLYGKPDLSVDDIIREGSKAVQMGIIPQQQLGVMLQGLPQDPQQLRQWVGGMALRAASAGQQLEAHAGQFSQTDVGPGIAGIVRNPMTGAVNPAQGGAAYLPKGPTPGEATARVEGPPDDQGRPTQRPALGAAVEAGTMTPQGNVNVPPPAGYGGNRLVAPPSQAPQPNRLNVQPPSVSGSPARVRPPQAPAVAAPVAGDLSGAATASQPTGLPPGQADAAKATGLASGVQMADDATHAAQITQRLFPLTKSITALEGLGKTGTGPGTEAFNTFKSALQSAGFPGIDAAKIQNFDEAKKYLTDYVNRTGNSGTNDKLAAAFAGNPSVGISNAAAVDVAKSAVALDRMRAAQVAEFRKEQAKNPQALPDSKYSAWAADWNKRQDPRAFGADLMGPAKVRIILNNMKTQDERARFTASLRVAHDNQLTAPGAQ